MGKKNRHSSGARVHKREIKELTDQLLTKCTQTPNTASQEWEDYLQIHQTVQRIQHLQKGGSLILPDDREACIPEFLSWLQVNDVDTSAVQIKTFAGYGLGLSAGRDLQTADLFLKVPRKIMMTSQTATESLGALHSEDRMLEAMPNVTLAIHLLCEARNEASFWKPYINMLPRCYSTPLYFSPEDMKMLKGSLALNDALSQYRNIARQYAYLSRLIQTSSHASKLSVKDNFTYEDYRWAVSTVMTRQNPIPVADTDKMSLGLIPLWDMCNHDNGQISTDFKLEDDCGYCYCMRDFKQSEQLFIFYGKRSNKEFLVHNGFVFPDNIHDSLSVKLGVSKNDTLCSLRSEVLSRLGILPSRQFSLLCSDTPVDSQLVAFLRVFVMDQSCLERYFNGDDADGLREHLGDLDQPLTAEMEQKAWNFLDTRATLLLRSYPSTLEDDEKQLEKGDFTEEHNLILQLLVAEKQILHKVLICCQHLQKSCKDS